MTRVTQLRIEHETTAVGIGNPRPRISWQLSEGASDQLAYSVMATYQDGRTDVSAQVEDSDAVLRHWPFRPLRSRQVVFIQVKVWTRSEGESDWSEAVAVEAGLLTSSDWVMPFLSPSVSAPADPASRSAFLMRARFELPAEGVQRVRVYATAHGVYELHANGIRVGDEELAPGWTSYGTRLRYQTYDVAPFLETGVNTLGVWVADGWYRGRLGFNGGRWDNYGADIAALVQVEVTLDDGSVQVIRPVVDWQWAPSAITSASLYDGEVFDERAYDAHWCTNESSDTGWAAPVELEPQTAELVAPTGPPVRVVQTLPPVSIEKRDGGRIRLDFGQNMTGRLRIVVPGGHDATIRLHHAEVLENDELATRPLRGAPSVDTFIKDARTGEHTWAPRFTFHGFRYAEIEGWIGDLEAGSVVAEVLHSDMERTGWFSSSHPQLNQLHENVVWSMRDNFLDLPTDCPQRDERLGWTGDIQVFAPTASYLFRSAGVLSSWLTDLWAEQKQLGTVPNFVPWIECGFPLEPTAAWGDAAVVLPWVMYQRTGDRDLLARQFDSMRAWVLQVAELTGGTGLWSEGFQLGDWLDPTAPPDAPDAAQTDRYLVSTAYHVHSSRIAEQVADVLGLVDEKAELHLIAEKALSAFRREFVAPSGRLVSDSETSYALAIVFDLLETAEQRAHAGRRLAELVEESDYRIQTGFVGTPIICDALASTGSHDVAYHLLLQTQLPSWLYPITMGATTIWERWDSMLPDGSINPGEMTSFNHYSLGAVADYLHRVVAGLTPAAPGYREVRICPRPGGGLVHASAEHVSPYGRISTGWSRDGESLTVHAVIPPGVSATIDLPGRRVSSISPGRHRWTVDFRAVADDPAPKRRVNVHNPEERVAELAV